jgi:hypothetical protein
VGRGRAVDARSLRDHVIKPGFVTVQQQIAAEQRIVADCRSLRQIGTVRQTTAVREIVMGCHGSVP